MRRTIAAFGRSLVTVGILILLFVGYQLWGTGFLTARAQNDLEDELDGLRRQVAEQTTTSTGPTPTTEPGGPTTTTTAPDLSKLPRIGEGDPVGRIVIEAIGVDWVFVQGTSRDDLKKGPGHFPATPMPGQNGNAAIAGHRTTYGAPFHRLDELRPGDTIVTETLAGRYEYRVRELLVVRPSEIGVVANTPDPQLTLTTCNPKYSARERLVVKADLVVENSDEPTDESPVIIDDDFADDEVAAGLEEGLSGDPVSRSPTVLWGAITLLVGLAWWFAYRRFRHPLTWFAGAVPFLPVLFTFYVFLERVLPAGY
ncbi:MAG TPA: class E sortase [Acidimicrobiia bacterium]|nr:class E sortase [Acidimicrobiia bacterium]